jgi:hypothetical protein
MRLKLLQCVLSCDNHSEGGCPCTDLWTTADQHAVLPKAIAAVLSRQSTPCICAMYASLVLDLVMLMLMGFDESTSLKEAHGRSMTLMPKA